MRRSLHRQLGLSLLVVLGGMGGLFGLVCVWTAARYLEEMNQRLHYDVAQHIMEEVMLIDEGGVNRAGLEHIFHMLMVVNPGIEVYLLDPKGYILEYSAPPGRVQKRRVALEPIERAIDGPMPQLPFLGDDPRKLHGQTPFSAARIGPRENPDGYVYVIVGSERFTSVAQLLAGSHILRLSVAGLLGCLALATGAGLIAFFVLTRRLRRLHKAMDDFEQSGFEEPVDIWPPPRPKGDELDALAGTFSRLSEAMTAQLARARRADALRRALVANVSHDLRTPLASLTGYIETLLIKDGELDEGARRRYLEVAHRQSRSLGDLVARLFELAKLEARHTEVVPEPFCLAELVQDVVQKFKLSAQTSQIHLGAKITPELPYVWADLSLIERVLDNLIDNAMRHTPKGGAVVVSTQRCPRGVVLEVADNGVGIAPEDLPFIFDRYFSTQGNLQAARPSGEARDERASERSGLGLAIAQSIAELHHTRIEVESRLGQGSRFRLTLGAVSPQRTERPDPLRGGPSGAGLDLGKEL